MSELPVKCAAILAGGASSRMGREKALIEVKGVPLVRRTALTLLEIFPEVVVVTAKSEIEIAAGVDAIQDVAPGQGPANGILGALRHFEGPVLVVACDMPWLNSDLLRFLASDYADDAALVPYGPNGPEPLHAIYGLACAPFLEEHIQQPKQPSLRRLLDTAGARFVREDQVRAFSPDFSCFANWNSPEDVRDTLLP